MSMQTWQETLIAMQADGTAVANSSAETTLLHASGLLTLPSNFFSYIGKTMKIKAQGRISNIVTSPGTLSLSAKLGTSGSPIAVWSSGAFNLNATAQTNASWELELELILRSIGGGTAATLFGIGRFSSRALVGSGTLAAGSNGTIILPDTAPAVGTGFDSTITNFLDLKSTFSVANSGNSIQCHTYRVESVN